MRQLILLIIVSSFAACFRTEPQKTGLEGKPLPEFSLLLPDSSTVVNTRNIPEGKAIVLFFFSPYCPYCREQTKEIIDDMDKLKSIQFYFITRFSIRELQEFNKEFELDRYTNITTGVDVANFLSPYFEIAGVPYTAIYGKKKMLNKAFMGNIYSSQLKGIAEQ